MTVCSAPDCTDIVLCKGVCNKHYLRLKKNGTFDANKKAKDGEPIRFLIESMVTDTDECIFWPFARKTHGQGCLEFGGKLWITSNFVCCLIYGDPIDERFQAAHSCGNGHLGCINWQHLSWKTPTDNSADRLLHGTYFCGEDVPGSVLTEKQVLEIWNYKGLLSNRKLGKLYGVSYGTISDIFTRRTWRHLTPGGV